MHIISPGIKPPKPWKKTITCDHLYEDDSVRCGAVFEIKKEDCEENAFGNQDERCDEYTYFVRCPTCKNQVHVPELDYIQKHRVY